MLPPYGTGQNAGDFKGPLGWGQVSGGAEKRHGDDLSGTI